MAQLLGIGIHGLNGHQIGRGLKDHRRARLVAASGVAGAGPDWLAGVRRHDTLEALLADPAVQLVSLCSPRRRDQAAEAVRCLEAGRHVFAEKPSALHESEVDLIIAAARANGRVFHEMAGSAFERPVCDLAAVVRSGAIGTVVQVLAQKSYPMAAWRPQDEDVDGGLILQNGIHAVRWIEHGLGLRVTEARGFQTGLGNPGGGGLQVAASLACRLEGGAVATVIANYCHPPAFGTWGNESLRVWGTAGMAEMTDGGSRTRLVTLGQDHGPIPAQGRPVDWFEAMLAEILDGTPFPLTIEDELHPLRTVIRARAAVT